VSHIRPIFLGFDLSKVTFGYVMGLLDLDKIIIKRTIYGIRCTACGGNLRVSAHKSMAGQLARLLSLGRINPQNYECETCKKRFVLLEGRS
jgi:DNA-directed RNA polymerase subunit RPC12/RpoP